MAHQRIHNRRAAHGSPGGGASWISYSDMMAALLLIFVLILTYSLYQYFTMLETKTKELDEERDKVRVQENALKIMSDELDQKEQTLIIIRSDLDSKEEELNAANLILISKEEELEKLQNALIIKQADLDKATARLEEQQLLLASQASRIDDLVGIRTAMIRELSTALSHANLKATVDPNNGDIVLDSSVFFESGKYTIKQEGQELLNRFVPVYLNVLPRTIWVKSSLKDTRILRVAMKQI